MANPPSTMHNAAFAEAVDHVIRERRTAKILRDPAHCADFPLAAQAALRAILQDIIPVAGYAPFHKAVHKTTHCQGELNAIVPWRFYMLEKPACCALLDFIRAEAEANPGTIWTKAWESKVPRLLAGAGALVQVTWLPDPPAAGNVPELNENNIEHIAAASAAVQNLMLAAEARGLHTYWASGGILKSGPVFDFLGIPRTEMLLGAIYLAPPEMPHDEVEPGALREKRGDPANWSRWVTLE